MPYLTRFVPTDDLITNLTPVVRSITDAATLANYAGFISVSAITVYELAIKDIFIEFAIRKNLVFGNFIQNHFSKINGRIQLDDLKKSHIKPFGIKYLDKFKLHLDRKENTVLRTSRISIKENYKNLITCRHSFVHGGTPTLTVNEVVDSYTYGKEVINCLNRSMKG